MALILGRMTCSSFYVTVFPNGLLLGMPSYSVGGRVRTYTYIMESRLAVSFGKVADRERKHPGEEAFGRLGASGKEASGIRGSRAPGRRVARAFLGLFTVLGRLALGSGPIEALGLGRLARGTDPGPMVPTYTVLYYIIYCSTTKETNYKLTNLDCTMPE